MKYYHGTSARAIASMLPGKIDTTCGYGGELGLGFYIGSSLWRAFSWGWMNAKTNCQVIEFTLDEVQFLNLNLLCKNRQSTLASFHNIKQSGNYKKIYDVDAIWAPIVGQNIQNTYQIKFEKNGEKYINSQPYNILTL